MENELILPENYKQTYNNIVKLIETAKRKVFETANFETVQMCIRDSGQDKRNGQYLSGRYGRS